MNIGFDAKRLFLNTTGLGNYSRYVVDGLLKSYPDETYFLFSPKAPDNTRNAVYFNKKNIRIIEPSGMLRLPVLSSLWRSALQSGNAAFRKLDIFHGLSNELPPGISSSIKKLVTIHDVIFMRYPQFYPRFDVNTYRMKTAAACKRADRIIAVSQQTADDLVHFFGTAPDKISVVYQGCDPRFRIMATPEKKAAVLQKYHLPNNYILNVGTIQERKNVHVLIEAAARLPESDRIPILIIGGTSSYMQKVHSTIAANKMENHVLIRQGVSMEDLPAIYQQARIFVYPSLFEGFGIPIIEAIESGVPVISSKGSCFSEAGGPAAIYTDPKKPSELYEALKQVLHADKTGQVSAQKNHVRKFLPENTTQELFNIYRSLL